MLPVLAYHLKSDLSFLECVLDDDPVKNGWHYENLPLAIRPPEDAHEWMDASVMITAPDNAQPILKKLLDFRPKNIIYPLPMI
jgi:hypothetical protein